MAVVVITPPDSVVTADEAVEARVFSADDDVAFVQILLDAAQAQIDGPPGWLNRSIGFQTLEYRADEFCREIILPCPPVIDILNIYYKDTANVEQELDISAYHVYGSENNKIEVVYGTTWPAVIGQKEVVRIRYDAGYEDNAYVPASMKHAIMQMAAGLKEQGIDPPSRIRAETVDGLGRFEYQMPASVVAEMRSTAERILGTYWVPFV